MIDKIGNRLVVVFLIICLFSSLVLLYRGGCPKELVSFLDVEGCDDYFVEGSVYYCLNDGEYQEHIIIEMNGSYELLRINRDYLKARCCEDNIEDRVLKYHLNITTGLKKQNERW